MKANLSIMGLYCWDDTILDGMALPAGIDRSIMTDTILTQWANNSVVMTNWGLMKRAITAWSRARVPDWEYMLKALNADYNPVHNYDRTEEWSDSTDSSATGNQTGKVAVAGFNQSAGFADSNTDTTEQTTNASVKNDRKGRAYGNIGVTTTQQMIESEIKLRTENNIYDIISREFGERFCILIY